MHVCVARRRKCSAGAESRRWFASCEARFGMETGGFARPRLWALQVRRLGADDPDTRATAAAALGEIEDIRATDCLAPLVRDRGCALLPSTRWERSRITGPPEHSSRPCATRTSAFAEPRRRPWERWKIRKQRGRWPRPWMTETWWSGGSRPSRWASWTTSSVPPLASWPR